MGVRQETEQACIQASSTSSYVLNLFMSMSAGPRLMTIYTLFLAYDRWKLKVISDQDEGVCEAQWTKTCGQRDLRGFVDDAVIKASSDEQRASELNTR